MYKQRRSFPFLLFPEEQFARPLPSGRLQISEPRSDITRSINFISYNRCLNLATKTAHSRLFNISQSSLRIYSKQFVSTVARQHCFSNYSDRQIHVNAKQTKRLYKFSAGKSCNFDSWDVREIYYAIKCQEIA